MFVVCCSVMAVVSFIGIYGVLYGNPKWLMYHKDSLGRHCGIDADVGAELDLWYPDPSDMSVSRCVLKCPLEGEGVCVDDAIVSNLTSAVVGYQCNGNIANQTYGITESTFHICLPKYEGTYAAAWDALKPLVDKFSHLGVTMIADLHHSFTTLAIVFGASLFMSFYMLHLLQTDVKKFIVYTVIGSLIYMIALTVFLFNVTGSDGIEENLDTRLTVVVLASNLQTLVALAIGASAVYQDLHILRVQESIHFASHLIRESVIAVRQVGDLEYLPVVIFPAVGASFTLVLLAFIGLSALSWNSDYSFYVFGYFVSGCLVVGLGGWLVVITLSVGRVTAAGAFAEWYWIPEPRTHNLPSKVVMTCAGRALAFHMGSIIYGSFLAMYHAPVQKMTALLPALHPRRTTDQALYMNDSMWAQVALHGTGAQESGRRGAQLLQRNVPLIGPCMGTVDTIISTGEVCVSNFCGLLTLFGLPFFTNDVVFTFPAVLAAMVIGRTVCAIFLAAYTEAGSTMLQNFCEDAERNNGSPLRAYYMPQKLKAFILAAKNGDPIPDDDWFGSAVKDVTGMDLPPIPDAVQDFMNDSDDEPPDGDADDGEPKTRLQRLKGRLARFKPKLKLKFKFKRKGPFAAFRARRGAKAAAAAAAADAAPAGPKPFFDPSVATREERGAGRGGGG